MKPLVEVLLATYQGGNYIESQIQSLLEQTHDNFKIIVRDDGSTDNTRAIVDGLARQHPSKIQLLPPGNRLGVKGNFSSLLASSTADYLFFCDQDDLWLQDKMEITLAKMKEMETEHGSSCPLLVHTDLRVADRELKTIDPSFWHFAHLNVASGHTLNRLLVQNVVTGCTMLVNRSLALLAFPIPNETLMHDWWMALVASAFGHVEAINKPTILYRQHSSNTLGAQPFFSAGRIKNKLLKLRDDGQTRKDQAKVFFERYQMRLSVSQRQMVQDFIHLDTHSLLQNRRLIFKHRFFKNGFLRNLALLLPQPYP